MAQRFDDRRGFGGREFHSYRDADHFFESEGPDPEMLGARHEPPTFRHDRDDDVARIHGGGRYGAGPAGRLEGPGPDGRFRQDSFLRGRGDGRSGEAPFNTSDNPRFGPDRPRLSRYNRDVAGLGGGEVGMRQDQWDSLGSTEGRSQLFGRIGQAQRGPHAGRGPKGWKRSDESIRERVNECIADHPDIDGGDVEVTVQDGEVTLTGVVSDRWVKRLTEDVVADLPGVADVHNRLKVLPRYEDGASFEDGQRRR